ncbi:MAG: LamG-like jellyroll fold domain-containing protein [Candidatus Micrarchaeia archaeon]
MELDKKLIKNGGKKAQLFTLTTLVLFTLMLSVFFSFIYIETQYYQQQQSISISSGEINIATSINTTSNIFGEKATKQALSVLAYYEYNPSLRHGNFISNLTLFMHSLISNAILPNTQEDSFSANYLVQSMGNLTFYQYNKTLINNYASIGLDSVNETNFLVTQSSPFVLQISYLENLVFNQTGTPSIYSIPVNISINITNEPDLFYIQQGIIRNVKEGNINNLTSLITNSYASSGSNYGSSYGTVALVTNNQCPGYTSEEESSMILVANQLSNLNLCLNNFGGLITNESGYTPIEPYLIYPVNIILSKYFQNNTNVEVYPEQLEALNIQNLITAQSNNYYFSSPFTQSFIQRSEDNTTTSNYGIFSLSGGKRTAALFNGISSNIIITPTPNLEVPVTTNGITVNAWVMPGNFEQNNAGIITTQGGCGYNLMFLTYNSISTNDGCGDSYSSTYSFTPGVWYDIGFTVSPGSSPTISIYLDGNQISSSSGSWILGTSWTNMVIGSNGNSGFFNGSLSNIQIYNNTLSSSNMDLLYNRSIEGLPISNNGLVGWFELNGNANDISGQGSVSTTTNIIYKNNINGMPSQNVSYFNGVNSYISLPQQLFNYPTSGSTTAYSLSFATWFKTSSNGIILGQENLQIPNTPGVWVPSIYLGTDNLLHVSMFWHGATSDQIISTKEYNNNEWHFLVDTYSNGVETLYVDGNEIGSQSVSENSFSSNYYYQLGAGYAGGWPDLPSGFSYFNGELADTQIYNTALSAQQVEQLYKAGISSAPISSNSIVAWWPLDGNVNDPINTQTQQVAYPSNVLFSYFRGSNPAQTFNNTYYKKIPGIMSCTNTFSCYNANSSGVYLGNSYLTVGSKINPPYFNYNSFIASKIPLSGNFCVSFWILAGESTSTEQYPVVLNAYNGIVITTSGGASNLGLTDGSNVLYAGSITPLTWYHVTATNTGNSYTIYLNNNPGNTLSMATMNVQNLTLGSLLNGLDSFNGSIANLQLYSNTITSTESQQLYNEGIYGSPLTSNVVAWLPLNDNCYNYTYSQYDCYLSLNVVYKPLTGYYYSPNYPKQTLQNGWQSIGYGAPPS